MTQVLYNLRTSDLGYRITKFTDGEVESSYLTSDQACDCPAGHRSTCRHRQMLPVMLYFNLCDSPYFWNFDRGHACQLNGILRPLEELCAPVEQDTERQTITIIDEFGPIDPKVWDACALAGQHTAAVGLPPEQTVRTSPTWRRL